MLFCLGNLTVNAQAWDLPWDLKAHDVGQLHGHVGFGAPRVNNDLLDKYDGEFNFNKVGAGPFYGRLEYGLSRKLSVSVGVTYTNFKASWERFKLDPAIGKNYAHEYGVIVNNLNFNSRLFYHMYTTVRWDVYTTGGIGYDLYKNEAYTRYLPEEKTFNPYFKSPPPLSFDGGFGFRYFFLNRTAFYMEVGYGKSFAQAGFLVKIAQPKKNRVFN